MDKGFTVRLAELDDAAAISVLVSQLTRRFLVEDFSPAGAARLLDAMSEQAVRSYLQQGFRYHLAEQTSENSTELVGVVAMRDNQHLYHLFVAESAQGQGLASCLWQHAKASCLANGNCGEFTVNASLNAKAIYQAWGFVAELERRETKGIIDVPMRLVL
ncbi:MULTISPECIES: GNAT family N-acetyltransferase [unclassified Agarivorans]|uniref:GNAT family N-acetyltransferase n=1 Tax=unclassified Agarivorans TaxID=2636026 RepID=UPI0026E414BE|nr:MULTISPECIES: GNAT family N-acetyltransferase [unclassified Agarivorans]MDO6685379.1 GNAT family N-acetyltransferase [Agarivorans sp. 3_MG-2023]MDO6715765.1 GNAT family N-acetyltransferase [Agarivorans sp. 2_MG-2023]